MWGGIGVVRVPKGENQCVCLCLCVFGVSKQRHSVHSAFRESVMQAGRQPPFSWSTSMFYLSGVAKQAVCLTQQQPQQQQKSQRAFSSAPDERGTFVLEIMCWKMSVLWFISLNKLQIAQWQLLRRNLHHRTNKEKGGKAKYSLFQQTTMSQVTFKVVNDGFRFYSANNLI